MRVLVVLLAFFLASGASAQGSGSAQVSAAAQASNPEDLVKKVTADVLAAIQSDQQLQGGDRKKALALAEQKILPLVDFREATQLAVGRTWTNATAEQRERLVTEFRSMLIRIYSNAIGIYRGQTMKVLPVHMAPGATEATVRNQYISEGKQPVAVSYSMKKASSGWKIYDITVEGVSLVLTYRSEFEQITRASGVEGLIKRLQEKNA
jgi:phospholipid transport system substrate-binding protein